MSARYSAVRAALLSVLGLAFLVAPAAHGQTAYEPSFDAELVARRVAGAETPHLDVYTAVPNTSLRFLARTGGFEATYAMTVQVYHLDDEGNQQGLVVSRTFERAVDAADYDATQDAEAEDRAVQSLEVPAGRYAVELILEDGSSGRTFTREVGHVVRPVATAPVTLSDPLLLSRYAPEAGEAEPIVGSVVSTEAESFWVSYEVYAEAPTDLQVTYVVTEQNQVRERPSFSALLGLAPRQQADLGTPVAVTEPIGVPAGTTPAVLEIATESLEVGDYLLTVRLATPEGETVAEANKPFAVRWMGLDSQITDIDQAIAQLRYVARPREIRAMQRADTPEEKLRLFQAFWAERDPTPGTGRNEHLEEYYYRVSYANERYGRFRDSGWTTDRGEVFITFGEPDDVENHPFDFGTRPYQIWTYYGQGRRFIFVDETGSGDFQLLVPIWDDRTRM